MGRLDRLELENFKSYGGHVIVGPFKGFTAVVGTNGSGKSNLMDAISFVLGVRTAQLRGNQLRDLVYRNQEDENDDASRRRAYVKLVYQQSDGDDPNGEIEFMRTVTVAGSSEYRVKGRVVSLERYNSELAKIGVLVKARNFLVFQNEVESIASKSPRELSVMFEEVSESAELRGSYEDALAEKDSAEEQVTEFWRRRKGMVAEKRQCREQKEEAERFRRLQGDIADVKTESALYELFHVDEDLKLVNVDANIIKDELDVHERQFAKKESALKAEKRLVVELEKERVKLERRKRRIADEIEKLRPLEVKYETEKSGITRRIKGDERSLAKLRTTFEEGSDALRSIEAELKNCVGEIETLQNDIEEAEEASVSPESMAEYRSLKDVVATRTSVLQQELEVAKQNANASAKQKTALQARERDLEERQEAAGNSLSVYRKRVDELGQQIRVTRHEIDNVTQERSRLSDVSKERDSVRMALEKTINDASQALRDAKADMNESGRERAFNAAFENMRRLFPGVHGRLSDLCKPTQKRYREAVAVVFGKLMDAIVVDNERTGTECIRFLKDQRVGMATFIPLENVRPRAIDESLRRLGGTARLAIDVVNYDEYIHKAVLYSAQNAVVCDTLDEARHLRYGSGRKIKICSLDGTLINKAGFMTGGIGQADMGRARKWDRAEIETLKRKRHVAEQELQAMGAAESDRRTAASMAEHMGELQRKLSTLELDIRGATSSVQTAEKDVEHTTNEIEYLRPQLQTAIQAHTKLTRSVESIEKRLHGLENDLFGDFAARHGIENVQQFEEQFVRKSEKMRARKLELETKEASLQSKFNYHRTQQSRTSITRLEKRVEAQASRKRTVEESLESLGTKRAELESRAESVEGEISRINTEKQNAVDAIAEKRHDYRKENEGVSEKKKQLAEKRAKIEQLMGQRKRLLTTAKVNQVAIPILEQDDSERQEDILDTDGDAVMAATDAGDAGESDPTSVAVDVNVEVDYSSLSRRLRAAGTANKQREMLSSLSEKVRTMEQQLDGLTPNLRAGEHMSDVQNKLAEIDRETENARERARKAVSSFEDIKQSRHDRFSACFSHVAEKINEVYKQLTKSDTYPMGGTAYLSLEQQDEPYLGGIKFNAMPPTKRFRDMDQLSGGERTVAALALLFAIHDFRPSPFFVLDEVDAALDSLNVGKVSTYVKSRAPELQTIVISLKDSFYERADALIGIYRDVSVKGSRLLTLDLTTYDEQTKSLLVAAV